MPGHQMVIDDDNGQTDRLRLFQRIDRSCAAIDGNDEFRAFFLQVSKSFGRRTIPLFQAIRHVKPEVFAPCPEISRENC